MTQPAGESKQSKSGGVLLQSASRLLGLVLNFFFIPACIRWVGNGGYDAYLFAVSSTAFIGIADLGIAAASQRLMGEAIATGDLNRVATVYAFVRRVYALLAVCAFAVFLLVAVAISRSSGASHEHLSLLVLCGVQAASTIYLTPATTIAYCLGRYREVAWIFAIQGALTPAIGFGVVYYSRTPEALAASMLIGAVLTLVLAYLVCGARALPKPGRVTREDLKSLLHMGARVYPSTVTTIVGSNADRIQIKLAGIEGSLTSYGVGSRVPEQISQLLAPIQNTVYPELTRLAATDEVAFTRAVERNVRFTLVLAAGIILVPCAFSECILRTWLGQDKFLSLPAGIVWVMPFMALYRTLELVYGVIARAFFAKNVPQYVLPFSVFNAAATVFATVPMYRWQGVAGVGLMNALINITQLGPMIYVLKRFATPQASIRELAGSFGGILGLAAGLVAAIHFGIDRRIAVWHPAVGFFAAPVFGVASIVLMTRTGLCAVPDRVAARLVRLKVGAYPLGARVFGLPLPEAS